MDKVDELHAEIVAGLRGLTAIPREVAFVIIQAGDIYTQFGWPSGGRINLLPFEAVGDEFLPEDAPLTEEQRVQLTALGFTAPSIESEAPGRGVLQGVSPNWHQLVDVQLVGHEDLASKAIEVMVSVYGIPATDLDVVCGIESEATAYPRIDRSDFSPNFAKTDEADIVDIGWAEGELPGGRPVRVECWAQDQLTCVTLFLSAVGLEDIPDDGFPAFIEDQGLATYVRPGYRSAGVSRFTDPAGNAMLALNIVVGDEDGVLVEVPAELLPYEHPDEAHSL